MYIDDAFRRGHESSRSTAAPSTRIEGRLMVDEDAQTLAAQQRGLDEWLLSEDGRLAARHALRRRGLDRSADELVNEAWMKLRTTFARRSDPYPDMSTPDQFARFGCRVLDNLSRDWLRAARRAAQTDLALVSDSDKTDDGAFQQAETRILLEQLLGAVAKRAERAIACVGCPDEVAVAAALEVVHMALSGQEGSSTGRTWIDKMLHTALERIDGDVERSPEARNQRKSRCGRCATGLLNSALTDVVGVTS